MTNKAIVREHAPRQTRRAKARDYTVPSVAGAARMLDWLRERRGSLSEMSTALGISKSTAYAILKTLEQARLVDYDESTRHYRLGVELLALGEAAARQRDHVAAAKPHLRALVAEMGLTGLVAQPTAEALVVVHKEEGTADVRATMSVGQVLPPTAGALGKAHAAFTGLDPRRDRRRWRPVAFTRRTITDPVRYAAELEATRRRGYATSFEEYRLGVNAVAAPIFDHRAEVVLLLALIGFANSLSKDVIGRYGERLAATAAAVSRELGGAAEAAG